jgi:hypothetical protein
MSPLFVCTCGCAATGLNLPNSPSSPAFTELSLLLLQSPTSVLAFSSPEVQLTSLSPASEGIVFWVQPVIGTGEGAGLGAEAGAGAAWEGASPRCGARWSRGLLPAFCSGYCDDGWARASSARLRRLLPATVC